MEVAISFKYCVEQMYINWMLKFYQPVKISHTAVLHKKMFVTKQPESQNKTNKQQSHFKDSPPYN